MLSVAETTFDPISIDLTFLKLTPESMINYELGFALICNYMSTRRFIKSTRIIIHSFLQK